MHVGTQNARGYGVTSRVNQGNIRQVIEVNIVGERHIYSIHKTILWMHANQPTKTKWQQKKAGTEKEVHFASASQPKRQRKRSIKTSNESVLSDRKEKARTSKQKSITCALFLHFSQFAFFIIVIFSRAPLRKTCTRSTYAQTCLFILSALRRRLWAAVPARPS